jgi:putative phosphoribosyl transferase
LKWERSRLLFRDREDAARQLAKQLLKFELRQPLVLAIPRGGVATGAELANALHAELDIVLARKLRSPFNPELAFGAIGENGEVYLDPVIERIAEVTDEYLEQERTRQIHEIEQRKQLYRKAKAAAEIAERSVILTDDGIATGSTMFAAIAVVRRQNPFELIVAVPVAPADRVEKMRTLCDRFVCLSAPSDFSAVGEFYESFEQVEDDQVLAMLRKYTPTEPSTKT